MIPVLNAEATLGACLDAILAVDVGRKRRDVLVLDNGSTDRTVTLAEQRGVQVIRTAGLTIAALRNLGVRLAEGAIVAYVDSDCLIARDWLRHSLAHFTDSAVGAVGAPTEIPYEATWVQRAWRLHRHRKRGPQLVEWLPTENLLIRKSAFEEIGGFNEALVTCEDVDFCYRLGARYKIVSDPGALRSIHLGEAPTLIRFFRKEAWRGRGNLAGFKAHRFHLSELPSVLLPLYHLGWAVGLIVATGYGMVAGRVLLAVVAATMLVLPSAVLATIVGIQTKRLRCWPGLTLVYLTYAAARATAIVADLQRVREARPTAVSPKRRLDAAGH